MTAWVRLINASEEELPPPRWLAKRKESQVARIGEKPGVGEMATYVRSCHRKGAAHIGAMRLHRASFDTSLEDEGLYRKGFIFAGAILVAGCAGSQGIVPGGRSRRPSMSQYSIPDAPPVSATPNPVDPNSGLKIIGGTRARYDTVADSYDMTAEYGPYGPYRQSININREHLIAALQRCPGTVVATIADATAFVSAMWATFGSRISIALGSVSFTSLTLWEAVGAAMATVAGWEIVAAGIATTALLATLYEAYLCVGGAT